MPPSSTRAHVSIVLDGVQAQRILTGLANEAKNARAQLEQMKQQFAQGLIDEKALKSQERYVKQLEKDYSQNTKQLSDMDHVMKNLSSQTSRQLDAALKTISKVAKDVNVSTAEGAKKMAELREQEEAVIMQQKRLSTSYVDVKRVITELSTASEAHIRKALQQSQDELAHMKKTDAGYKQQVATVRALNAELDKRNGKMNGQRANQVSLNGGTADEIRKATEYYEKLKASMSKSNTKGIEAIDKRLKALRQQTVNNIQSQQDFNRTMQNLKTAKIEDLRKAEARLNEEIKHATGSQQDFKKKSEQLAQVRGQIQSLTGEFKKQESSLKAVANRLAAYVGIYGAFNFIRGQVTQLIQKNLQFSDTLSDIRKTTLMSEEAVALLSDRLKELDTRTAVLDVQKLAYEAGKLGITGVANVTEFVKAADQVNIALGEQLNGLESITELMKINAVMGTTSQYGIEQSLLKTGSAINYLSQTSTAVGDHMVDFSARLAGIAKSANITTAEVLGLSAASDALKQQVEVSATAFNKIISQMFTKTDTVAKAVGIEVDTLREKLEMGDTMDALLMVLDAVRKKGGLSETGPIMKDLGSDGARLLQVLNAMANNVDFVRDRVTAANKAFQEGTSVTNEYNIKNENAAALWERLKNNIEKYFVSASNSDYFKKLMTDLQDLPKWIDRLSTGLAPIKWLFDAIIYSLKEWTSLWAGFITAFTVQKILVGLANINVEMTSLRHRLELCNTPAKKLKTLLASNWVTLGITVVTTAIYALYNHMKEAAEEAAAFGKAVANALNEAQIEEQKLLNIQKEAEPVLKRAESAQDAYNKAVAQFGEKSKEAAEAQDKLQKTESERRVEISNFNDKYSQYLGYQLAETANYKDMEKAIDAVNAKLRMKALLNAKGDREQAIISDTAEGIETRRGTLKQKFMQFTGKDEAAAAEGVQYLREHYDEILTKMENGLYGYGDTARQRIREYLKVSEKTNVDGILVSLSDYVNAINARQKKIDESNASFDAEVRANAQQHNDELAPNVEKQWGEIKSFVELSDKEQLAEMKKQNGEVRDQRKKQVEAFLNAARLQAEDLRAIGTKEANDRLKEVEDAIGYAERYMDKQVLRTGLTKKEKDKANRDALKNARDEANAIISKIEAYYQMQKQVINRQYEDREITATQRERALEQIEQEHLQTRITARKRLVGKATEDEWKAEQESMRNLNRAGKEGLDQLESISKVSLTRIGQLLRNLGGEAEWDAIFKKAEEDETRQQEKRIKRIQELEKLLIQNNLLGKLTTETQRSMEELDILFADFTGKTGKTLTDYQQKVMEAVRSLGAMAGQIDLNTPEGIEQGAAAMQQTGVFNNQRIANAAAQNPEEIRAFFTSAWQYTQQYAETSRKAAKQTLDEWEKQYAVENQSQYFDVRIKKYEKMAEIAGQLEKYGLSESVALENELDKQTALVAKEEYRLKMKRQKAEADLAAAQNMEDDEQNPTRRSDAIAAAQAEMEQVQSEEEQLLDMYDKLAAAAQKLEEFNLRWVTSLKDGFDQFAESFIAFRSYYENKDGIWENILGTKAERQKAFGQFVDTLKKATRQAIMQKVQQRLSSQLQDKIELAWSKAFQKQKTVVEATGGSERQAQQAAFDSLKLINQKTINTTLETGQKVHNATTEAEDAAHMGKEVSMSMAEAIAKCFGQLGPIAGAVAVGVVTAVIGTFLTMAMNAIGSSNSSAKASAGSKTKLASGMLTYDEGNATDVLTDSGRRYRAVTDYAASGLVSRPTLTTVQGAPALVAEEGPELVVGRETTRALMMDHPNIVRTIMALEAHKRHHTARHAYAFDEGNASSVFGNSTADGNVNGNGNGNWNGNPALTEETVQALTATMAVLSDQLSRPLKAEFNMNGKGGAADQIAQGLLNSKRLGDLDSVRRLLGSK